MKNCTSPDIVVVNGSAHMYVDFLNWIHGSSIVITVKYGIVEHIQIHSVVSFEHVCVCSVYHLTLT